MWVIFRRKADEEERLDIPELTKEEKEAKKNARPKTRFGRVSKPPKHMIKVGRLLRAKGFSEGGNNFP